MSMDRHTSFLKKRELDAQLILIAWPKLFFPVHQVDVDIL